MSTNVVVVHELEEAGYCCSCDRLMDVARKSPVTARPECPVCGDWLTFAKNQEPDRNHPQSNLLLRAPRTRSATMARARRRIDWTLVFEVAVILAATLCCIYEKACK